MKYLNDIKELVLKLSADGINILKWFVDAIYVNHTDMKSHIVSAMQICKGLIAHL